MSETAPIEEQLEQDAQTETTPVLEKATPPSVGRFGLQEEHNQQWRLNVPIKVKPAQCLDEGFWAHIAAHLRAGDEIRVFPDDMTWELVLHVVDAGKAFAQVVQKAFYELAPREPRIAVPSMYRFDFAGTTHKHRVIRDGKVLRDGFATEALARKWAANHEAAVER